MAQRAVKGSARGLTLVRDWSTNPGPIFAVEGASDTLAMSGTLIRGFVEAIVVSWEAFGPNADRWLKAMPLRHISFSTWPEVFRDTYGLATLERVCKSDAYVYWHHVALQTEEDVFAALGELFPSLEFRVADTAPRTPGQVPPPQRYPWGSSGWGRTDGC